MKDFIKIFIAINKLLIPLMGAVFGSTYCLSIGKPILAFITLSLCTSYVMYIIYTGEAYYDRYK